MFSSKITNGKKHKLFTQAYFMKDNCSQVLLGYKKRGFAPNKWSGFGGKVEVGETIKEAAIRCLNLLLPVYFDIC